jgi:hypothetical protein
MASTIESVRSKASSTIQTVAASVHCDDPDSLVEKQRRNVIIAVKQARNLEKQRLDRLDNHKLSNVEREKLLERFNRERQLDQERISGLMEDFATLQTVKEKGILENHIEHRKQVIHQARVHHLVKNESQKLNRFRGLETDMDKIFYADAIKKFEKHDNVFEKKMAPKFDMYAERQRLNLLNEKKNILKQLIQMESSALKSKYNPPASSRRTISDSDTASRYSDATSYSMATFASGSRPTPTSSKPRVNIPKLKI